MQLETYIGDLLYRYECVVIPEFGAFLTQSISAKINDKNNTFYPPSKLVSFNEQLKTNDGLLANYVADIDNIPYESALLKVIKLTERLKFRLLQGDTIKLKNIGDIVLNNENKISFEPSNNSNFLTDAFGLSQFVLPIISRKIYKEDLKTELKTINLITSPSGQKVKSKSFLKYVAIAVIALIFGGFMASNYHFEQIKQHNQIAQEKANKEIDAKIQEATFIIDNPLPAITLNVTKQSGNFHIVAGAFRIKENCDRKLIELRDLGYNARKIGANKYGLHQVVYSSYNSRSEAQNALFTIRRNHNQNAWLLVQKLN